MNNQRSNQPTNRGYGPIAAADSVRWSFFVVLTRPSQPCPVTVCATAFVSSNDQRLQKDTNPASSPKPTLVKVFEKIYYPTLTYTALLLSADHRTLQTFPRRTGPQHPGKKLLPHCGKGKLGEENLHSNIFIIEARH